MQVGYRNSNFKELLSLIAIIATIDWIYKLSLATDCTTNANRLWAQSRTAGL